MGNSLDSFPQLNVLISQFKCAKCHEIMKIPMLTSCGHSYCSHCIQSWITTTCKPLCPTCQSDVQDISLRKNLSLDNCIIAYLSLQNKLDKLVKSIQIGNSWDSCVIAFPQLNVFVSQLKCGICHDLMKTPMLTPCGHSYCSFCIRTWITNTPLCPMCHSDVQDISLRNNVPLENCIMPYICLQNKLHGLSGVQNDSASSIQNNAVALSSRKPAAQRREPLKKMVYNLMSDKELKKKLSSFCLSTRGNRSQLVNRLQRYRILYNSECDSLNPRPVEYIRKQLEKDEAALTKVAPTKTKTFQVSRHADPTEIEEINKQYRAENKSAYNDLIQQIREREQKNGEASKHCAGTSMESSSQKIEVYDLTVSPPTSSKKNRLIDEFLDSKRTATATTSKSQKVVACDDLVTPRSSEKSQKTPAPNEKKGEASKHCAGTSVESSSQKIEVYDLTVSPSTTSLKRRRLSNDDSDELLDSTRTSKTSKFRKIEDSDNLFTPRSSENLQKTPVRLENINHGNSNGVISQITPMQPNISTSEDSTDEDLEFWSDAVPSRSASRRLRGPNANNPFLRQRDAAKGGEALKQDEESNDNLTMLVNLLKEMNESGSSSESLQDIEASTSVIGSEVNCPETVPLRRSTRESMKKSNRAEFGRK